MNTRKRIAGLVERKLYTLISLEVFIFIGSFALGVLFSNRFL